VEAIRLEDLDLMGVVERVLAGEELERPEGHAILNCPDERLAELLAATLQVREAAFGRRVKVCILRNAQSGICPEDCGYCSQSRISRADIPVYKMQSVEELCEGARMAVVSGARRYCMVCSMRGPGAREIDHLAEACSRIRGDYPTVELCRSLGLMSEEQARRLKRAGAGWINHNLNTSRRFYPEICTTHTWDDRVRTLENVRAAGLSVCSGGNYRDGPDRQRRNRSSLCDAPVARGLGAGQLSPSDRGHAAGARGPVDAGALSEGGVPVSPVQSPERGARCRRT
jgi:biotin synthase